MHNAVNLESNYADISLFIFNLCSRTLNHWLPQFHFKKENVFLSPTFFKVLCALKYNYLYIHVIVCRVYF